MRSPTEAGKLKSWLAGKLRISRVRFEKLWTQLKKNEWVRWVLEGTCSRAELHEEARRRLRETFDLYRADGRKGRQKVERTDDEHLSEIDKARASAVACYLTDLADRDWDVRQLRAKLFDSRLLTEEEAINLLESQAACVMMREDFDTFHIPLLGHGAAMEVLPNGLPKQPPENGRVRLHFMVGDDRTYIEYKRLRGYRSFPESPPELVVPNPRAPGSEAWLPVWRGSVLDDVRLVSEAVSGRYPFTPVDVTWYLLTGQPPQIQALHWEQHHRAGFPVVEGGHLDMKRITFLAPELRLTLAPWVSDDSIKEAFQAFQRNALRGRDDKTNSIRSMRVLQFVTEAQRFSNAAPNWKQLHARWIAEVEPAWRYRYSSDFKQTYERAVKTMILLTRVNPRRPRSGPRS